MGTKERPSECEDCGGTLRFMADLEPAPTKCRICAHPEWGAPSGSNTLLRRATEIVNARFADALAPDED